MACDCVILQQRCFRSFKSLHFFPNSISAIRTIIEHRVGDELGAGSVAIVLLARHLHHAAPLPFKKLRGRASSRVFGFETSREMNDVI